MKGNRDNLIPNHFELGGENSIVTGKGFRLDLSMERERTRTTQSRYSPPVCPLAVLQELFCSGIEPVL